MKHFDLPYVDKLVAEDVKIQAVMIALEDALNQCSNKDHSNRAMALLCQQTYQNLQHIRDTAAELVKRRAG